MPKLTCYIIDDNPQCIANLLNYIAKVPFLIAIGTYQNPLEALSDLAKDKTPDIVFLDINMPILSGLDVAALLEPSIYIIFTTANSLHALKAFEVNAVDYLLKPFSIERFIAAVLKVRKRMHSTGTSSSYNHDQIFINPGTKGKLLQIYLSEITHIEALEHSIRINQLSENTISNIGINKIQELLPIRQFARVHRGFIVNVSQIRSVERKEIVLRNNIIVPIGESYRDPFFIKLNVWKP